jgi:hypothetical protein
VNRWKDGLADGIGVDVVVLGVEREVVFVELAVVAFVVVVVVVVVVVDEMDGAVIVIVADDDEVVVNDVLGFADPWPDGCTGLVALGTGGRCGGRSVEACCEKETKTNTNNKNNNNNNS